MNVPVNEPVVTDAAKRYVMDALNTGWISSAGEYLERFEREFASYIGMKHAVSTTNGTTALHLALAGIGIGEGDEVIVPDFTIVSCLNAVLYTGATPVFVDVDPETFTLNPDLLEASITEKTKAIMPVHIYGHSCDMDPILEIAEKHYLFVVEDAAEVHGATYKRRKCGSMGTVSAFSFYSNKIVTTGEGGMVLTNDDRLAQEMRLLVNLAHSPGKRFWHEKVGFNYRLTNFQAALGLGQLQNIEEFLAHKKWLGEGYTKRLSDIEGLILPVTKDYAENVYWMYSLRVSDTLGLTRDELCGRLKEKGVDTRTFFIPLSSQPIAKQYRRKECPVSASIAATGFYLPSGLALTGEQMEYVCNAVHEVLSA
ncbi:aminotransferase DegT [Candidatus Peribacteria bacterium RIFOXYC2_FULL_55_14]|nr:MAG: DegT/DnrJ/EryC1/StrS aminotransferase [Candidatus Peribacteria bacterium GW2011_GWC2_54_8]KKW44168.1 MAG: DegT/DnrJ/EryC1/StrS aminotransferase [Candidatus Peregrinibacteria bacterium GW2011_GWA2_54_9]OGJ71178.1 MAG: aminotransferase DegT [Candidatus Peribacteria bacterium RIFOXYA1_FULL_56_14]OGJ73813.1 MAG: aminotransferase DegT [Candidatus Peribacteria bacterium RIFOXYB1_FULL_54_35]OGJ74941.1 MAG: aminotransferase DegT [Candidatus Peribacteria bacterium RIFOXYA2_FULL_55_28]OGJ77229.1